MPRWILVLCLLGICSAMPMFPQHTGIPGMGSITLEYARHYTYPDPFHVWMHNFLPPHSSPPYWGKRRLHDHDTQQENLRNVDDVMMLGNIPSWTEFIDDFIHFLTAICPPVAPQYEYTMPVHPPPLPSQQTPLHGLQEQFPFLVTNQIPFSTRQGQLQQYDLQLPFQHKLFPKPEGPHAVVQQFLPLDKQTQQLPFQEYSGTLSQAMYPSLMGTPQDTVQQPQQRSIYPNVYYMPFVANQGAAPGRLGIVSSEEMQGGGAPAYRAMSPDVFAMGAGFGNPPPNRLGQPGDYTVEDDQLGITEQPEVQPGANKAAHPSGNGNSGIALNSNNLGGALSNANSNLMNPAGQSKGPAGGPQVTVNPLMTQGLPDSFLPFEADTPVPLDPTMSPDAIYTPQTGNEAGQPQDGWHFQEP